MTVELQALLRRRGPEKQLSQLRTRPLNELLALSNASPGRVALVPDTNVYIKEAAGTLPRAVEALLDRALLFHCSVCLAELATGIAKGDPTHPRWKATRDHYANVMKAVPETRVLVPDLETWIDASTLAGTLARTQGFQPNQRKETLNDALILLTSARAGLPVLTSNRDEFDLLQQLAPEARFYHY